VTPGRLIIAVIAVIGSVLLQVTLLPRLGLPGATPNLILVVTLAYGFVRGPAVGAVVGFSCGLLVDLLPVSLGYIGLTALLLALAGYLAGDVGERTGGVVAVALITVAGAAVGYVVLRASVATLLGDVRVSWADVPLLAITEAVYATLMAALVVPVLMSLDRRLAPRALL